MCGRGWSWLRGAIVALTANSRFLSRAFGPSRNDKNVAERDYKGVTE
jgi:hypothetical protein